MPESRKKGSWLLPVKMYLRTKRFGILESTGEILPPALGPLWTSVMMGGGLWLCTRRCRRRWNWSLTSEWQSACLPGAYIECGGQTGDQPADSSLCQGLVTAEGVCRGRAWQEVAVLNKMVRKGPRLRKWYWQWVWSEAVGRKLPLSGGTQWRAQLNIRG